MAWGFLKPDPRECDMKSQNRDANGFEYRWVFRSETLQEEGMELKEYDFSSYEIQMTFIHCDEKIYR
jgi:hypothetical protein